VSMFEATLSCDGSNQSNATFIAALIGAAVPVWKLSRGTQEGRRDHRVAKVGCSGLCRIHDANRYIPLTQINRDSYRSQIISNVGPDATLRIEFRVVEEVPAAASATDTPRIYGMETRHEHR
jgi:hypothetical protein